MTTDDQTMTTDDQSMTTYDQSTTAYDKIMITDEKNYCRLSKHDHR